ncbi:MAG: hypothetical protein NUV76_06365 [Candidatus Kuenenia sp.]|nr:hypothetical protein [Candidatus Kuenenia sp.]
MKFSIASFFALSPLWIYVIVVFRLACPSIPEARENVFCYLYHPAGMYNGRAFSDGLKKPVHYSTVL